MPVLPQTADIAKLRAIISEAIYALSLTEGSEPFGARREATLSSGLFLLKKLKILRTNQAHRPHPHRGSDLTTPTHGLERRYSRVNIRSRRSQLQCLL